MNRQKKRIKINTTMMNKYNIKVRIRITKSYIFC